MITKNIVWTKCIVCNRTFPKRVKKPAKISRFSRSGIINGQEIMRRGSVTCRKECAREYRNSSNRRKRSSVKVSTGAS